MTAISLVAFDLDDTLIATKDAVLSARKSCLNDLGWQDTQRGLAVWRQLSWYFDGTKLPQILPIIARELGYSISEADAGQADEKYQRNLFENLRPSEGVVKALDALKDRFTLGIVSTGIPERQKRKLQVTGLEKYFTPSRCIFARSGEPNAKPWPHGLQQLAQIANVEISQAVYVGDRLVDCVAAHLAGCKVILYPGGSVEANEPQSPITTLEQADQTLSDLAQLPAIIERLA